jgi:hypothetical protein
MCSTAQRDRLQILSIVCEACAANRSEPVRVACAQILGTAKIILRVATIYAGALLAAAGDEQIVRSRVLAALVTLSSDADSARVQQASADGLVLLLTKRIDVPVCAYTPVRVCMNVQSMERVRVQLGALFDSDNSETVMHVVRCVAQSAPTLPVDVRDECMLALCV